MTINLLAQQIVIDEQVMLIHERDLYWTISLGMISNLVTLAIISSIDDTPALAISAVLIATLVFVLVSSFDCMDDLKAMLRIWMMKSVQPN